MHRLVILGALVSLCFPWSVSAQNDSAGAKTDQILAAARQELEKGEACFKAGDFECARLGFDRAVDSILDQRIDVRSDPKLRAGLQEIVERIYRYETQPVSAGARSFWKSQDFSGAPAAATEVADVGEQGGGPL